MSTKCICTGVRLAFASTVDPLARVPLLSAPDVLMVKVLHQAIHVAEVTSSASLPHTYGDLVAGFAAIVVILVAQEAHKARGVRDVAGAVGGDGGCR